MGKRKEKKLKNCHDNDRGLYLYKESREYKK